MYIQQQLASRAGLYLPGPISLHLQLSASHDGVFPLRQLLSRPHPNPQEL